MKAFAIDRFGTEGDVRDLPQPKLDVDSVLVRVCVAGVNPIDWKIRDGKSGSRAFPLVLGQDFAGVVEQVGRQVTRVRAGDRVFGCARAHGAYAEETAVPDHERASPFSLIPDGLSDAVAAALPTPALTALASLSALGAGKDTTLLVVGAAGAVGTAAVQMAHLRGSRVSAYVRPGQEAALRALGAHETISSESDDVLGSVRAQHPEPFDVILDLVSNGETLKRNAPLLRQGGKLVTTIHVADEKWFGDHGLTAINIVMNETPQSSPEGLNEVAKLALDGKLRVDVLGERALGEAGRTLDEGKAGKLSGKMLLRIA
jgi:NADPH:quinone reductase-like Zn-dependent oxidoreductase